MDGEQVAGGRADGSNLALDLFCVPTHAQPNRARLARLERGRIVTFTVLSHGRIARASSAAPTGAGALSTAGFAAAPTASRGAVSADPFQIPIHSSSLVDTMAHQRACCASSSAVLPSSATENGPTIEPNTRPPKFPENDAR